MTDELAKIMRPESEAELSDLIRAAGPLIIRGGGTRAIGLGTGTVLDMRGLSGVSLYEPGALTIVVQAGTALAEVEAVLAEQRQRLAFEVPDLCALLGREGRSTVGGVVAANASGPRRVQVGAARDAVLGVRFVDGSGHVIKNGGRVMKNVTGYDLVKLMAGSQGRLGVLTELAFKVQAMPEAEVTLVAEVDVAQGLVDLRRALASPYDVSGAGYISGKAALRLEGMAGSVAYRAGQVRALLGEHWREGPDIWPHLRDITPFAGKPGAVWRLVVKPSEAARLAGDLAGEKVFDWGGGLIWLLTLDAALDVRAIVAGFGHATLIRGLPGMTAPAFPPEAAPVAALTAGLRAKFDPRRIFNTGGAA